MGLGQSLNRLAERIAHQQVLDAVERAAAHHECHGLPFGEEDAAAVAAFQRHKRTWPDNLDIEQQIRRAAAWWGAKDDLDPADIIAEAERLADECTEACPDE